MTSSQLMPIAIHSRELVSVASTATSVAPTTRSLVSPLSAALALATPAATTAMLLLARHWSDNGARHSIGDMVPLALGTGISLAGACWSRPPPTRC